MIAGSPQSPLIDNATRLGLAEARRLLAAGRAADAADTLQHIDEDLALLERRLGGDPCSCAEPGGPRRALVVEDNANERELLALFLRNAGLDVDTARDGVDGGGCDPGFCGDVIDLRREVTALGE